MAKLAAVTKRGENLATGNELAARIILADPARYDGLMVAWARLWVSKNGANRHKTSTYSHLSASGR